VFGIAFSCENFDKPNYADVEAYVLSIVEHFLLHRQQPDTILNINFPETEGPYKGFKLTRQGRGFWGENPEKRIHPDGHEYYWHGGKWQHHEEIEESDVALLKQGYVTAVPVHVKELTDHQFLKDHKEPFEKLFLR
jgi:5'-nucleotidase